MRPLAPLFLLLTALAASAADPAAKDETLRYVLNWPTGLSLGEGELTAKPNPGGDGWSYELLFDVSLPGFPIRDRYRSASSSALCSVALEKVFAHGTKKGSEKTEFDAAARRAVRKTLPEGPKGGETQIETNACPQDALTFLQFLRRELAQGRVPSPQTVYFGASYQLRMEFGGVKSIVAGGEKLDAERVVMAMKGPASNLVFEMFFARDAVRTPVLVRIPLALGTFTVERVR